MFQTVWGDLRNQDQVREVVRNKDIIIHLAAMIPPAAYRHRELAREVNVQGTKNLLEACKAQAKKPRFFFAYSYSVTGSRNPWKSLPLIDSSTDVKPGDLYGKHKVECKTMIRQCDGEWVILRLGAVSVILSGMLSSGNDSELLLYSIPANERRHGVHSKDAARAFVEAAITKKPISGKTLLIGGDST